MVNWDWVTPRVATGGKLAGKEDVQQLIAAGVTDVLDLAIETNDSQWLAESILAYCWNPTEDDGKQKPLWWWQSSLRFALPAFAQPERKVYFHCFKGQNRGPSTAALVMMALGWSSTTAASIIRTARPEATLRYLDQAAEAVVALGYR